MGYSLNKKQEGANKQNYGFPVHPPSQPPIPLPTPQNPHPKRIKIGEWLVSQKWITPDQLRVALTEQTRRSHRLGELYHLEIISDKFYGRAIFLGVRRRA